MEVSVKKIKKRRQEGSEVRRKCRNIEIGRKED